MELIYHITDSVIGVDFLCRQCSRMVQVRKKNAQATKQACECGMGYWVDWVGGYLHMNTPEDWVMINPPAFPGPKGGGDAEQGGGLSFEDRYRQWKG